MTDGCDSPEDLDRLFGPEEHQAGTRSEQDPGRLLEVRIAQLDRQQRVFEDAHQQIVVQNLETSDALLTEQRAAPSRLEQEVADRTKEWRERVAALEQTKGTLATELLTVRQRLLTFTYAVDAKTKSILEAVAVLDRDVRTARGHRALTSIRSSAAALQQISDPYYDRTAPHNGTADDHPGMTHAGNGSPADSDPPFDPDMALARAGGDADLMKELAIIFLTDGPKRLLEARAAIERGDGVGLGLAAHTLKGAAGVLSAGEVTRVASELEQLRRVSDLEQRERIFADLEAAMTRLLDALRQFCDRCGGDERDR